MEHFDLDDPRTFSAAARELAARKSELDLAVCAVAAMEDVSHKTKTELAARITELGGVLPKNGTVKDLAAQVMWLAGDQSVPGKEHAALAAAARMDAYVAGRLNEAMNGYAESQAAIVAADDIGYALVDVLAVMTARHLAHLAGCVHRHVAENGGDLRAAVMEVAHAAMRDVMWFPDYESALTPTGDGCKTVAKAKGSTRFLRIALATFGEMVPRSLINL